MSESQRDPAARVPQTLLNLLFKGEVIFPGTIARFAYSAGGMIVIWLAASIAIGCTSAASGSIPRQAKRLRWSIRPTRR